MIAACSREVAQTAGYEFKMFVSLCLHMSLASVESATYIPGNLKLFGTSHSEEEPDMLLSCPPKPEP